MVMLYDGFTKIEEVTAVIKGKEVKREKIHLKNAVGGLVVDENNRIGLVYQYRPTIGKHTWEIPAGVMDKDLTRLGVLLEELEEECAITTSDIIEAKMTPFHTYYQSNGVSDSTIELYLVRVKAQEDKVVEDSDVEEVRWFTPKEMAEMVNDGTISDGKTIISFYRWFMENLTDIALNV